MAEPFKFNKETQVKGKSEIKAALDKGKTKAKSAKVPDEKVNSANYLAEKEKANAKW